MEATIEVSGLRKRFGPTVALYYSRCLSSCSWTVALGDVRTFN